MRTSLAGLFFFLIFTQLYSQVGVGTSTPDPSAVLDIQSSNKGFLLPRMNTIQQKYIEEPATGLVIYNLDSNNIYFYTGAVWLAFRDILDTIKPWRCGDSLHDQRDGQNYGTVRIGTQCWFKENLNIGILVNGSQYQYNNSILEKYCYNNNESNCGIYGGLYQWDEMMLYNTQQGRQGICPHYWHIPADAEWCTLTTYIDATVNCSENGYTGTDVGTKMKCSSGWNSSGNGTNTSGFSALPGGGRGTDGTFGALGNFSFFWSSEENDGMGAWGCGLTTSVRMYRDYDGKTYGNSARCIKDEVRNNQPPFQPSNPDPPDNSSIQYLFIALSWSCSDPNYNSLTFDLFFGTDPNPSTIIADDITNFSFLFAETLMTSTTYYWKIIATDNQGSSTAGEIWQFTTSSEDWQCGNSLEYAGKTYQTIQIGTQCWLKENLNVGRLIDKIQIMNDNQVMEKYCYNNDEAYCTEYGGLYKWDELMQYTTIERAQGICPPGWHIPTDTEWTTLSNYLGGGSDAGGKMKETETTHWYPPNTGATNESGFTALPGGYLSPGGIFFPPRYYARIWSSTGGVCRSLIFDSASLSRLTSVGSYGQSVRCLKIE